MTEKSKTPADTAADERGSQQRPRPTRRITTPGDQAQSEGERPLQRKTIKHKDEGPPAR